MFPILTPRTHRRNVIIPIRIAEKVMFTLSTLVYLLTRNGIPIAQYFTFKFPLQNMNM